MFNRLFPHQHFLHTVHTVPPKLLKINAIWLYSSFKCGMEYIAVVRLPLKGVADA